MNPDLRIRKAQNLNPVRAQKLNKIVVQKHFQEISKLYLKYEMFGKPSKIFNLDEKGCRLNLHKEPKVLAKKGSRRVHIIGNEHDENVTIAACVSAARKTIPPMILFKGKRMKPEFLDDLPDGVVVSMTDKESITCKVCCRVATSF